MPGYTTNVSSSNQILIFEPDTLDELYDRVFYGMTFDPESGKISIEVIKEDEPIELPTTTDFAIGEYAHWFASSKQINFTWKEGEKTHLLLEVI